MFTLVLKGHLALGQAQFPEGVSGQNLDYLARAPLWEKGLDFRHGTGHGVGFLLSVHEGPQRISWNIRKGEEAIPLQEGMVVSNEPGFYSSGKFGIRHENLLLCRKGKKTEYGQFLYFEPLTMVPFDLDAVDPEALTRQEADALNAYHRKVYETLAPHLEEAERQWLANATRPIEIIG
jgi:Xaa-Pro aminopeptidase